MLYAFDGTEQVMPNRGLRRMALQIVDYIFITLHPCLKPKCMREVMEKVSSHPRLSHSLPNYVLPTQLAKTQQEVWLSLNMSIDANKLVQSNMSLVNKNVLLNAATFNVSEGNIQNVIKVFGIHPRLIRTSNFEKN